MNFLFESGLIAIQAIWSNKLRSFLTVLGNIVAVTSIIAVVSLIQGMNAYVTDTIVSGVGADNFTIQRVPVVRTQEDEERVRNNPRLTMEEAAAVRKFSDNIGAVAGQANARALMTYRGESVDGAQVQGVSRDYLYFSTFDVERGRLISPMEIDSSRPVTVLGCWVLWRGWCRRTPGFGCASAWASSSGWCSTGSVTGSAGPRWCAAAWCRAR